MVSIVLVTYNRAERLALSIREILDQTYGNFELIICDDCSTDNTESICLEFAARDPRIRYFRHSSNMQMPGNLNFGIRQSIYEYIAILHDGDRYHPELIQQWFNAISNHESVGFVFNTIGFTDENEHVTKLHHEFEEGIIKKDHLLKNIYFRRWRFDSPVHGEVMTKRQLVIDHDYMKTEYGFYADVDLWMQLLHTHDAYYCSDLLITGPTKKIQPRLFEDNIVKFFLGMVNMHWKHRKLAYQNKPLKLFSELLIFCTYSLLNSVYCLLLIVKNSTFKSFLHAFQHVKRTVFLIPWLIILLLYPLLYPCLKFFTRIKRHVHAGFMEIYAIILFQSQPNELLVNCQVCA